MTGRGFTHPALLVEEDNRYRAHGRKLRLIAPSRSMVERPGCSVSVPRGDSRWSAPSCSVSVPRGDSRWSAELLRSSVPRGDSRWHCHSPLHRRYRRPLAGSSSFSAPPWSARALPHPLHRGARISPGGGCAKTDGSCWSKSERGRGAGDALAKKGRARYCLTPMEACSPWGGQGSRGPACRPQPVRDDPHPTGPRPRP